MCAETLRAENIEPVCFWYNPNIHPLSEYKARRNALAEYCRLAGLELLLAGSYGLREFISMIYPDFGSRCPNCYRSRLESAAKYAAENSYESFSTTLLISPYQNHGLIKKIAEELAAKYGARFLYRDFRPYFREGQQKAREQGLYMQKYCGCIFSEEERFRKNKKTPKSAE
jgi:predicted adenine nucleotide alpha hydrolase (AANH) superfamily ATPase